MDTLVGLSVYTFNGENYFSLQELKKVDDVRAVVGVKSTNALVLERMEIPDDKWIAATRKKEKLTEIDPENAKTLYVKKKWTIKYLQRLQASLEKELEIETRNDNDDFWEEDREVIEEVVSDAPEEIILTEREKLLFQGALTRIEVRGTRTVDECVFLMDHVAEFLGINEPEKILHKWKKKSKFMFGYHYLKYRRRKRINGRMITQVKTFLTFEGMLLLSTIRQTVRCVALFSWAARKLFTMTMGTPDDRVRLASQVMGVGLEQGYRMLLCTPTVFEGLYSFVISDNIQKIAKVFGFEKLLRKGIILDTDLLIKVGRAAKHKDTKKRPGASYGVTRRLGEHVKKLKELCPDIDPTIVSFGAVGDRQYSQAEKEVIDAIKLFARDAYVEGHTEMFFIPVDKLKKLRRTIERVLKAHDITHDDLFANLGKREAEIELLNRDMDVLREKLSTEKELRKAETRRRRIAEERLSEQLEMTSEGKGRTEELRERINELQEMNALLKESNRAKDKIITKLRSRKD